LLIHQPWIWRESPHQTIVILTAAALLYTMTAYVGGSQIVLSLVPPLPLFVLFVGLGGVLTAFVPIAVAAAIVGRRLRMMERSSYATTGEDLSVAPQTRLVRMGLYATYCAIAMLTVRSVEWGYTKRVAALRSTADVVRDLRTMNAGAEACCTLSPTAQACLDRQRLPRSLDEELVLVERYGLPPSGRVSPGLERQTIREAGPTFSAYAPNVKTDRSPEYRDYERAFHRYRVRADVFDDPRPEEQRICAELNFVRYRTADINTSRILNAQRIFPEATRSRWILALDVALVAAVFAICRELDLVGSFLLWLAASGAVGGGRFGAAIDWNPNAFVLLAFVAATILCLSGHVAVRRRPADSDAWDWTCARLFAFPGLLLSVLVFDTQPLVNLFVDRALVVCGTALVVMRFRLIQRWNLHCAAVPRDDFAVAGEGSQQNAHQA
jgi:hypothetical protein